MITIWQILEMKSILNIFLVVFVVAFLSSSTFGLEEEKKSDKYIVAFTGTVIRLVPLEEHSFIVVIDKGKQDGVKTRKMSLRYHLKTIDAEIALVMPMARLSLDDLSAKRFERPFIAFLKTVPEFTAIFFWTYHKDIRTAKASHLKAGKSFEDIKPKIGDKVQFVVAK